MSKAAFSRKYTLNATGILSIEDDIVSIENPDTAIIAIDAMAIFDFHKLRGCLGRLKYKNKPPKGILRCILWGFSIS